MVKYPRDLKKIKNFPCCMGTSAAFKELVEYLLLDKIHFSVRQWKRFLISDVFLIPHKTAFFEDFICVCELCMGVFVHTHI